MLAISVLNLCFFIYPILAFHTDENNVPCATVMCESPCPAGQYLKELNGCETCDCYDPCEGVTCEKGRCHWKFNDNSRPETFCIECTGGREWTECGGGGECLPTCANPRPLCPRNCYAGCQCPFSTPVWHQGKCITVDDCDSVVIKSRILRNKSKPESLQLQQLTVEVKTRTEIESNKKKLMEGKPNSRIKRIKIRTGKKVTPE